VRAEILAALVNSLIMLALIAFIVSEAIDRLGAPRAIDGGIVTVVAGIGLLINIAVAWRLSRGQRDLNTRAALLHVMGDLLGSVAAISAGLVISLTGWTPIDPLLSLLVAGLILLSAWRLLREALHVLLEAVPAHLDIDAVSRAMAVVPGVTAVHDLHIWTLSSGQIALSAHLDVESLAAWSDVLAAERELLMETYAIGHITLQPEDRPPQAEATP
jgi:cobalt-zinc-cadmium efflux system protein